MAHSLKARRIPHLIFGVGTYHFPTLRQSISLFALDRIASHLKLTWQDSRDGYAQVAEGKGFLLVKPRTYQIKDNYKAFQYILKRFPGANVDNCTVVHHDLTIPIGTFQVGFAGQVGSNEGLSNALRVFKTETFRKFGIGIGPQKQQTGTRNITDQIDPETIDLLYTYNKMPQDQKELVEKDLLSDLDYLIDCLLTRHKIVRSDKRAIEVSQIQQLIRQTALRQKALYGDLPVDQDKKVVEKVDEEDDLDDSQDLADDEEDK